jgi:hypothetical protein
LAVCTRKGKAHESRSFGEGACEKIRKYLDSYISNELLIETNHEVLRHVEKLPSLCQ